MKNISHKIFLIMFLFFSSCLVSQTDLEKNINRILTKVPAGVSYSVLIIDPITMDTLYSRGAEIPLIPASTTKMFTTAAALHYLGEDFKLKIAFYADIRKTVNGISYGNLYIEGGGDALFFSSDLTKIIEDIKKLGVKEFEGNLICDDSFFDKEYTREDWVEVPAFGVEVPPVSALVYNYNYRSESVFNSGKTYPRNIYYGNPPIDIGNVVKDELKKNGIKVKGKVVEGKVNSTAKMIAIHFVPLDKYIQKVNKLSDNFLAENLYKIIGATVFGSSGSKINARDSEMNYFRSLGLTDKRFDLFDGSGLCRDNKVNMKSIAGLLIKVYFDKTIFESFFNSLTIAGVDGTLFYRMRGTGAQNNFRGKTGTIAGVSALSGYIKTAGGQDLVVCQAYNYQHGAAPYGTAPYYRLIQDEILSFLAKFKK